MDIGKRLRQLREARWFSQGDIARRTGMLRYSLSALECGHKIPRIDTIEKLAAAMGVPLWQVFTQGNKPSTPPKFEPPTPFEKKLYRLLHKASQRDRDLFLAVASKLANQGGKDGQKRQARNILAPSNCQRAPTC